MTEVENCPFCNPADRVLKENEHAQLLLSNPRKVPGHALVVPKRHVEKPWELTAEELQDIFALIYFVEQKILGKLGDGVDIRQNYRPFKSHTTNFAANHILFHVVPRAKDDYIYSVSEQFEKDLFAELDAVEAKEVAKLLEDKA